ncbi:hypothetical protein [Thiohalophilus sp.]|uniref:hypothetical protein n=1 Tax=Thiohalophilus sp. TaxID=3028392 RepID=UPI002ACED1DE|nr:hypothetical protein [Thiohalophilus sp.]MDZ7661832.1 hypothetical protein [Thiohalophilus sp.]
MPPLSTHPLRILLILLALLIAGCSNDSGGGSNSTSTVVVNWDANRESGVNTTAGGYRVYYSTTAGFDIDSADFVDVPYESGDTAPTSTTLTLPSQTHYIKVVAYSALNPQGSAASEEIAVNKLFW